VAQKGYLLDIDKCEEKNY